MIYHVKVTHSAGKVIGETLLAGTTGIFQFFIQGNTFIGPNLGNENDLFWKYPCRRYADKSDRRIQRSVWFGSQQRYEIRQESFARFVVTLTRRSLLWYERECHSLISGRRPFREVP